MTKYLFIAGHGWQRDGSFDPGATGFITKGEYKYMVEDLFPAMKKYIPKDADVVFYTEKKVSNHGTLKRLVDKYGADEVVEFHFDAFSATARGGHVIIHHDYAPDAMDLRIRDIIGSMMKDTNFDGLRFTHRGHKGISGRSNLYNVNMARKEGITYRLLELGFGTNKREADIMINRVDEYAKKLVEAILDVKIDGKPIKTDKPISKPSKPAKEDGDLNFNQVVTKTINNGYGNTPERRNNINSKTNFTFEEIQAEVNRRLGGGRTTSTPEPTITRGAKVTLSSKAKSYATGEPIPARVKGKTYTIQDVGNGRVLLEEIFSWVKTSDLVGSSSSSKPTVTKTVDQVAREVLYGVNYGGWGTGEARRKKLRDAGYDPPAVQRRINQLA